MDAGQLRHRITVCRKSSTKNQTTGAPAGAWAPFAENLPASVRSINGREALIGNVLLGISHFEIIVRHRSDLLPSDQIIWLTRGARELNIHSAEDKAGTRQWLTIIASTEAPEGAGAS